MAKDHNQVELERQQQKMSAQGADHSEINNPNQRSEFNATGKTQSERNQSTSSSGGCLIFLVAAIGIGIVSATAMIIA